jgi:diguanylate cyclase (GGDEF)-like protein
MVINFFTVYSITVIGVIVVIVGIELTFKQVFRLRRRSVYPSIAIAEIGSLERSVDACQASTDLAVWLLELRSATACRYEDGEFSLAARSGIDRSQAERLLRVATSDMRGCLQSGVSVRLDLDDSVLRSTLLLLGEVVMLVPIKSLDRPFGVLAVIGQEKSESLADSVLLQGIGLSLGLALENLGQREALREMATLDGLTGLYNRRYFFEQLERETAEARRYNGQFAVLMMDMDGLKHVNDSYGHMAGDEALCAIAQRLLHNTRASDIVARLGGDEFAVILPRSDSRGAQDMLSRLSRAVKSQPLLLSDGTIVDLVISCGFAVFPDDGDSVEAVTRQADASMYASKAAGRVQRGV